MKKYDVSIGTTAATTRVLWRARLRAETFGL